MVWKTQLLGTHLAFLTLDKSSLSKPPYPHLCSRSVFRDFLRLTRVHKWKP